MKIFSDTYSLMKLIIIQPGKYCTFQMWLFYSPSPKECKSVWVTSPKIHTHNILIFKFAETNLLLYSPTLCDILLYQKLLLNIAYNINKHINLHINNTSLMLDHKFAGRQTIDTFPSASHIISSGAHLDDYKDPQLRKSTTKSSKKYFSLSESVEFNPNQQKKASSQVKQKQNLLGNSQKKPQKPSQQNTCKNQDYIQQPVKQQIQKQSITESNNQCSEQSSHKINICKKCRQPDHLGRCDYRILLRKINQEGMVLCTICQLLSKVRPGQQVINCQCGHSYCIRCFQLRVIELSHICLSQSINKKTKKIQRLKKLAAKLNSQINSNSGSSGNVQNSQSLSKKISKSSSNPQTQSQRPIFPNLSSVPLQNIDPVIIQNPNPNPYPVKQFYQSQQKLYPTQILNLIAKWGGYKNETSMGRYFLIYMMIFFLWLPLFLLYTVFIILYIPLMPIVISFIGGFVLIRNRCRRASDGLTFCCHMFVGLPFLFAFCWGYVAGKIVCTKCIPMKEDLQLLIHLRRPRFMIGILGDL